MGGFVGVLGLDLQNLMLALCFFNFSVWPRLFGSIRAGIYVYAVALWAAVFLFAFSLIRFFIRLALSFAESDVGALFVYCSVWPRLLVRLGREFMFFAGALFGSGIFIGGKRAAVFVSSGFSFILCLLFL